MRRFFLLLLFFSFSVQAQFSQSEIHALGLRTISGENDSIRVHAQKLFHEALVDHFEQHGFWEASFDSVKTVSVVDVKKTCRILTYAVPRKGGYYNFYGIAILPKKKSFYLTSLSDTGRFVKSNPEKSQLKLSQWYGAIYYDVVVTKKKKDKVITLLGYRPQPNAYHQKVIDVLDLSYQSKPRFGQRVFETSEFMDMKHETRPYRLVMRYGVQYSASVRWYEKEEMIIADHLSPPDASQKRFWEFYGPDFTYDGLYWENGAWNLKREVRPKTDIKPVSPGAPVQKGLPKKPNPKD